MKRALIFLAIVFGCILLLLASPLIFWRLWDGYHAPRARRAVAAAVDHLVHGEVVPQLHLRPSVSQAELSQAFSAGYTVVRHDPIGMFLNAYEVMVRASGGDQYNFDAYKLHGEWQLDCCTHVSAEELEKIHLAQKRPNHAMERTADRCTLHF